MKGILHLIAVASLLLPACFDGDMLGGSRLVLLFTGDTLGEIEPCG